jgi:cyclic-di-GMP-binding biofilm dispersal mediator protein
MELRGKTILVTGGSGAFGTELVNQLSDQGANVLATATSNDSAAKIPNRASVRLLLDFEYPESIETLTQYLLTSDTELDGIINASGVVAFGPAGELTAEARDKLFNINTTGPMRLISELLPALQKSKERGNDPFVLSFSGVVAEQTFPGLISYAASKTAMRSFLEGLGKETRKHGIRVIDARPGHTESGLADRAIAGESPKFPEGMTVEHVIKRVVDALINDETDLASDKF